MGYTIMIGEAFCEVDYDDLSSCWTVHPMDGKALGAPIDSRGMTPPQHSNETWPSYTGWAEAMKSLGLWEVWYGSDKRGSDWIAPSGESHECLLACHPGVARLTADHLAAFEAAADRWRTGPQMWWAGSFASTTTWHPAPATDEAVRWNQIRADWLVWWTRWALANCKHPVVGNS